MFGSDIIKAFVGAFKIIYHTFFTLQNQTQKKIGGENPI